MWSFLRRPSATLISGLVESPGALPEAELVRYLTQIGLEDVRITARFDCFRATSKEETARKYGVHGVNVFARKPI
jgi:hypothetical protein